jgi:hypothetical protein
MTDADISQIKDKVDHLEQSMRTPARLAKWLIGLLVPSLGGALVFAYTSVQESSAIRTADKLHEADQDKRIAVNGTLAEQNYSLIRDMAFLHIEQGRWVEKQFRALAAGGKLPEDRPPSLTAAEQKLFSRHR